MVPTEVRTRTTVCRLEEHDILRVTMLPGSEETLADAKETLRSAIVLLAGRQLPFFIDLREMKSQNREARQYYGTPEVTQHGRALALLVGSRMSMLIANFFISVSKTTIPTRIFTDEAEALEWLKGMRK